MSTNLSKRCVEYHHPKTYPNMPVYTALRASISLPRKNSRCKITITPSYEEMENNNYFFIPVLCMPVYIDGTGKDISNSVRYALI